VARAGRRIVKHPRRRRLVLGRRDECQPRAVRRPSQRDDLFIRAPDRARFAAGRRNQVNARLLIVLADERKRRAVGRDPRQLIAAPRRERRNASRRDPPDRR
jgi:hypothetical protein